MNATSLENNFSQQLYSLCEESKQNGLINLNNFIIQEHRSNPNFKKCMYTHLDNNKKNFENDYFERVIKVLLDTNLFDFDKVCANFCKIDIRCSFDSFHGYSLIQSFSPKSTEKILNNINSKKEYFKNIPFTVSANYFDKDSTDFKSKLFDFLKSNNNKKIFIVYQYKHYTPLLVEKYDGGIRIVITDSRGKNNLSAKKLYPAIQDTLSKVNIAFENASIYFLEISRQNGNYGCGIFSIRDAVHIAKNTDKLWEQVLKSSKEENNDKCAMKTYNFSSLPPEMILVTHSLQYIKKYDEENRLSEDSKVENKLRKKGKIINISTDNKINERNLKAEIHLRKYVVDTIISEDILI